MRFLNQLFIYSQESCLISSLCRLLNQHFIYLDDITDGQQMTNMQKNLKD